MLIGFLTEYFRLQAQFAKTELEDDKTKPSEKLSLESEIRQFYKIAEVIAAGELSDMIIQMPSRYRIDARKFAIARVAEHLSINKDLVIPRNDSHKPLVQYLFSE